MIIIGVDPHPDSHSAAALDGNGKVLSTLTVSNTEQGLADLRQWAAQFEQRCWAIEGANNRFVTALSHPLAHEERVVNVSPSLTSQYRSKRSKKKNDIIDAENVARVLLANPELPPFEPRQEQQQLKELVRTRERLADELKAHRLAHRQLEQESVSYAVLTELIQSLKAHIQRLEKAMQELIKRLMPDLLNLRGVGIVHASTLLAEVGDISRFKNADAFASYCGCAPVERASGRSRRVQLNTGGNRRLNRSCHLIGIVRLKLEPRTRAFVTRKEQEGKTTRAALRALKTYIARELYTFMRQASTVHLVSCSPCS